MLLVAGSGAIGRYIYTRLHSIFGKIIRIDPLGGNSANGKYGIPLDNPFVDELNVPHEIWAYGFRNPWRSSFDTNTGELWVADVGQNELPPANSGLDTRVAVVGGYVYHGEKIDALRGAYVFGDYSTEIGHPCAGHLWVLKSKTAPIQELDVSGQAADGPLGVCVLAFAQDTRGELYALVNAHGTLIGVTGQVLKLTSGAGG